MGLFRKKPAAQPGQGSPGRELRELALNLEPAAIGLSRDATGAVWGLVLDAVFDEGDWYSLVVLADGTTSLYTSSTYGVIGAGTHASVRAASNELLAAATDHLSLFTVANGSTLPAPGMVAIRALTFDGQRVVVAPEDDFGYERHAASAVFHGAHKVIGLVRLATGD